MLFESSVCPHCRRESPAWLLYEGGFWTRSEAGDWRLLDEEVGDLEALFSEPVKNLVAGSGIAFVERGEHELKGVSGEWRLYAVEP